MVKSNNCGITGQFPKKCHKPKKSQPQRPKPPQTNVNQIDTNTTKCDDEKSVNYTTIYQQLYVQVYNSNYDTDSDDYVAAISSDYENQLEPLNAKIKYGNVLNLASSMIDSSSVCSLITKTIAYKNLKTTPFATWIITKQDKDLITFSNEPIKVLGKLATTITYDDWTYEEACLTVVEDGHKLIIGRDVFTSLGLAVVQQQANRGKCVNNIDNSTCKIKRQSRRNFQILSPELASQRLI